MRKSVELQSKIAKTMEQLEMTMGVFVSSGSFAEGRSQKSESFCRLSSAAFAPGNISQKLQRDYQMANCIENLKVCAEVCEPAGLILVLEPLNWWANHPGLFLTKIPQAYLICKGVLGMEHGNSMKGLVLA